jgi:predicted esterase
MPSWYVCYCILIEIILARFYHRFDLYSFDIPNRPEDETGLFAAVRQINNLIDAEIESGIPPHRVIVGGLSQGAAVSVLTGLATERKLAGIFALSGYIPLRGKATSASSFTFAIAVYKDN